jgi:uncharacterized protein YkwD
MKTKPIHIIPILLTITTLLATSERDLGEKPKLDWDIISKKIVYLTNLERQMRGMSMLRYDPVLTRAAEIHTQYMAESQIMSHSEPVLFQPIDRITEACKTEKENCMRTFYAANGSYTFGENVL